MLDRRHNCGYPSGGLAPSLDLNGVSFDWRLSFGLRVCLAFSLRLAHLSTRYQMLSRFANRLGLCETRIQNLVFCLSKNFTQRRKGAKTQRRIRTLDPCSPFLRRILKLKIIDLLPAFSLKTSSPLQ